MTLMPITGDPLNDSPPNIMQPESVPPIYLGSLQGCVCPPTSERTCRNVICPRLPESVRRWRQDNAT